MQTADTAAGGTTKLNIGLPNAPLYLLASGDINDRGEIRCRPAVPAEVRARVPQQQRLGRLGPARVPAP
ncbi:MAG TPA: hypothetical protein VGD47_02110 [Steroidobacteraceae bacterium]